MRLWGDARRTSGRTRVVRRALELFFENILQRHVVESEVGDQLLEALVFDFQRFEPASLGYVHAAILRLPAIKSLRTDAVLSRDFAYREPGLLLLKVPMICDSENLLCFTSLL